MYIYLILVSLQELDRFIWLVIRFIRFPVKAHTRGHIVALKRQARSILIIGNDWEFNICAFDISNQDDTEFAIEHELARPTYVKYAHVNANARTYIRSLDRYIISDVIGNHKHGRRRSVLIVSILEHSGACNIKIWYTNNGTEDIHTLRKKSLGISRSRCYFWYFPYINWL